MTGACGLLLLTEIPVGLVEDVEGVELEAGDLKVCWRLGRNWETPELEVLDSLEFSVLFSETAKGRFDIASWLDLLVVINRV